MIKNEIKESELFNQIRELVITYKSLDRKNELKSNQNFIYHH